jgi:cytochrome c1
MGKFNVITRLAGAVVLLAAAQSFAAGGAALEHANIDPGNIASLQRGARNFMNYCSGCHSAKYVRYNTIGKDLELSEEQLIENLMFNAEKTFEAIEVSMPEAAAGRWFGVAPPDLSLIGRARLSTYSPKAPQASITRFWQAPACRTSCGSCRASNAPSSRNMLAGRRRFR